MVGSFELWHGRGLDGRLVGDRTAGPLTLPPDASRERHAQTWTREDAAKAFLVRAVKAAIGGQPGWHPAYQGPLIVPGLLADRFGAASRFREAAPAEDGLTPQPDEVNFDPTDFKARLAARKRQAQAAAQAAADLAQEQVGGVRRVKAMRTGTVMLADLPVYGHTSLVNGQGIPGRIHSCNPAFAVIEAKVSDLDRFRGSPIYWVYDPTYPFHVGLTGVDHK